MCARAVGKASRSRCADGERRHPDPRPRPRWVGRRLPLPAGTQAHSRGAGGRPGWAVSPAEQCCCLAIILRAAWTGPRLPRPCIPRGRTEGGGTLSPQQPTDQMSLLSHTLASRPRRFPEGNAGLVWSRRLTCCSRHLSEGRVPSAQLQALGWKLSLRHGDKVISSWKLISGQKEIEFFFLTS